MESLSDLTVNGVSILLLVIGLTQWAKEAFGLQGNQAKLLAVGFGLLLGGGFVLYENVDRVPDARLVFEAIIVGLAVGLSATGLYDTAKSFRK